MDNQPTQPETPVQSEEKIPYQTPTQTPPLSGKRKLNWKGFILALIAVGLLDWGALTLINSDNQKPTPEKTLVTSPVPTKKTISNGTNPKPSQSVLGNVLWEVPQGKLSQESEKELKKTFLDYDNSVKSENYLVVTDATISTISANFIFTSMEIKDKSMHVVPTDGFEYLLHKEGTNWKIYNGESANFCAILRQAPRDLLTASRKDYYNTIYKTGCIPE